MATTVFVGCSKQEESSSITSSTPVTTTVSDTLAPDGVDVVTVEAQTIESEFDQTTLFHWVEEPTGSDLAVSASEFAADAEQNVGELTNESGLPVFVKDSTKYLHAGNLNIALTADGEFKSDKDAKLVRYAHEPDTESGAKVYIYNGAKRTYVSQMSLVDGEKIIDRTDKFWSVLGDQVSLKHEDYVISTAIDGADTEINDNALVWYNGIATDTRADGKMIPLNVLTDDFSNIIDYTKDGNDYKFTLYTGIGSVGVTATEEANNWVFKYSLPENCLMSREDIKLPAEDIKAVNNVLYVSSKVLTTVFNYFLYSFSSVDMGDGSTDDVAVIVTDNQDILKSDKEQRNQIKQLEEEANKKVEEKQAALEADRMSTEEAEADRKDSEERQKAADAYEKDTNKKPAKTTSEGDLAEPVTSVPGVDNSKGKDKTFKGDKATALRTTLPEGCYWSPTPDYPNAYTDAAGNLWINNQRPTDPALDSNRNSGYYEPNGITYHPSQEEIEYAKELNAGIAEDWREVGYDPDNIPDDERAALDALFGL